MLIKNTNNAFTLAETLITLAIIGVVAAITIPSLMQSSKDQQFTTAAKKAYSTLSSAVQQMNTDNFTDFAAGSNDHASVISAFRQYLKNIQQTTNVNYNINYYKSSSSYNVVASFSMPGMILADGSKMNFYDVTNDCTAKNVFCSEIIVDTNGAKPPNMDGVDVIWFFLMRVDSSTLKIVPDGTPNTLYTACTTGGTTKEESRGCSFYRIFRPDDLP